MMKKQVLLTKYKHQLILKNFSVSTVNSYLGCLNLFLNYIQKNGINDVSGSELEKYFYYCKNELNYSYSAMKQLL